METVNQTIRTHNQCCRDKIAGFVTSFLYFSNEASWFKISLKISFFFLTNGTSALFPGMENCRKPLKRLKQFQNCIEPIIHHLYTIKRKYTKNIKILNNHFLIFVRDFSSGKILLLLSSIRLWKKQLYQPKCCCSGFQTKYVLRGEHRNKTCFEFRVVLLLECLPTKAWGEVWETIWIHTSFRVYM